MDGTSALAKLREASSAALCERAAVEQSEVELIGEGYDLKRRTWWVRTRVISRGVEHHDLVTKADDSPDMVRVYQTIAA